MRMPCRRTASTKSFLSIETLALTVLVAIGPIHTADAYVDPNSAGSLYQMLFPLFIAIASAFAALRHIVRRLWSRLASALMAAVRGGRLSSDTEDPLDRF
jgi:hypothetical protein